MELVHSKDIEMDGLDPFMSSEDNDQSSPSTPRDILLNLPEQPPPRSQLKNYHVEVHLCAAQTYGRGPTFMDGFDGDKYAMMRKENLYFPWASWPEWELAAFLL